MKRFTRVFLRPHNEVDFYQPQESFLNHIKATYIDTGKCTKWRETSFKDANGLTIQYISEWTDDIDLSIATEDPVWAAERAREEEYNTACEIVCLEKTFESV